MAKNITSRTIVFVHGMFMNPKSWGGWEAWFASRGFACHSPAFPFHHGEPSALRRNISLELGKLRFGETIDTLARFIDTLPEKPILIGHSMGGLAVQKLLSLGKGAAAVAIDPAPPSGISSFRWSFLKSNFPVINPLRGDAPFLPSVKWFQKAFCNTMTSRGDGRRVRKIRSAGEPEPSPIQHREGRQYRFPQTPSSPAFHRRRKGPDHPEESREKKLQRLPGRGKGLERIRRQDPLPLQPG